MKTPEKPSDSKEKVEPKKLYGGYATKEELEARRKQFEQEVKESMAEFLKEYPDGEMPKVY